MEKVIFDLASPADAAAIAQMEKLCFPEAWSEAAVGEAMENGTFYIAARSGEDLIGYAGAAMVLDEGQVANIALLPDFRGRGLGREITKRMIGKCLEMGARFITLEVRHTNTAALNLYLSLGFKEVGRRKNYYRDPSADAILMTLSKEDYNG